MEVSWSLLNEGSKCQVCLKSLWRRVAGTSGNIENSEMIRDGDDTVRLG